MPIASLPVAPFSPCVKAKSPEFADTENVPAVPLHDVPSAISALTVLIGTLTATEAPTPTFDPLPPPSEGSARDWFDSSLAAATATLPPPVMVTEAVLNPATPGVRPTTASVSLITTLTVTEPATPVLPPPPPEVASVMNESVWSTSFWLSLPAPPSAIALPACASLTEAASWNFPSPSSIR